MKKLKKAKKKVENNYPLRLLSLKCTVCGLISNKKARSNNIMEAVNGYRCERCGNQRVQLSMSELNPS